MPFLAPIHTPNYFGQVTGTIAPEEDEKEKEEGSCGTRFKRIIKKIKESFNSK